MQYPNITKYKEAIMEADSFSSLNTGIEAVMNGYEPVFASGNFAVVFKMKQKGKLHALKCFLKDVDERGERQQKIVDYIKNNPSPYFVDYHYLKSELWADVDGGNEYPVSWMEWIEAPTLGEKIKQYCEPNDKIGLKQLGENFKTFALWILKREFAHGDLKHDNILVKNDGSLVLVDYDGMFVPAFSGKKTNEQGGKSYQHPKRNANTFNSHLDDFSILIISTSLLALSEKPELYNKYNNGQNIIFDQSDFLDFENGGLINELNDIKGLKNSLEAISKSLKTDNTEITHLAELIDNAITKKEYSKELEKTKQIIEANYDLLLNYHKTLNEPTTYENMLIKQKESINGLFKNLWKKLKKIRVVEEMPLTKEWWDGLSDEWKDLFFINIELVSKARFYVISKDPYNSRTGKAIKKINFEIDETILEKIFYLTKFYINKEYSKIISSLNPLENLTKLKTLCIDENKLDLSPISNLNNLKELQLNNNESDLNPISYLTNLKELELISNKADLSPIKKLVNLNKIDLTYSISGLNHISDFTDLTSVYVGGNKLYVGGNNLDIRPIKSLVNLTSIEIRGSKIDLSPISDLIDLKTLEIHVSEVNLNPISNLFNLTTLTISGSKIDLSPISNLINLKTLVIDIDEVDLHPISNLINLTSLHIGRNDMDLTPISNLKNLEELEVYNLPENIQDYSPINTLKKLKQLRLNGAPVDLNFITNLTSLKELFFNHYDVNVEPLANLTRITKLTMINVHPEFDCEIDLNPLSNLINLQQLILDGNFIQDLSFISKLGRLTQLSIGSTSYGNPWRMPRVKINADLSPIANLLNLEKLIIRYNIADVTPIRRLIDDIETKGGEVYISET